MYNLISLPQREINTFLAKNQGGIKVKSLKVLEVRKAARFIVQYVNEENEIKYIANKMNDKSLAEFYADNKDNEVFVDSFFDSHSGNVIHGIIYKSDMVKENTQADKVKKANERLEKEEQKKDKKELQKEQVAKANDLLNEKEKMNETDIMREESLAKEREAEAKAAFDDFTEDKVIENSTLIQQSKDFAPKKESKESKEEKDSFDKKKSKKKSSKSQ